MPRFPRLCFYFLLCLSTLTLSGCATHFLMSSERYKTPPPEQESTPEDNSYLHSRHQYHGSISLIDDGLLQEVEQRYLQYVLINSHRKS